MVALYEKTCDTQSCEATIRQKHRITVQKVTQIPGTFTQERPSYFLVDLFWLFVFSLVSLVFSGAQLQKRRAAFKITIAGDADSFDFSHLNAASLVMWLSENGDRAQRLIDYGNERIHFLAALVDPLPELFANPSTATFAVAKVLFLYCVFRFWLQHRQWRFNSSPALLAYAFYCAILWYTSADTDLALHIAALWVWPALVAISVVLHKVLGERAWKPRTIVLELRPNETEQPFEEYRDESEGLLESYERDTLGNQD